MKSILLYTAACVNGGERREAGVEVEVGDGKQQISADRAKALVSRLQAADAAKVKADEPAETPPGPAASAD